MDIGIKTESIWETFHHRLKLFITRRVVDINDVDDLLQDVFVKIHTKIDTLDDYSRIEQWLYQVTRNTIIDFYRKNKPEYNIEHKEVPERDDSGSQSICELEPFILRVIDHLPDIYREIIRLTDLEGLAQKRAAEKLGITLPAAKSRVLRGREKMKEIILMCCHIEFDRYGTIIDCHRNCSCPEQGENSNSERSANGIRKI